MQLPVTVLGQPNAVPATQLLPDGQDESVLLHFPFGVGRMRVGVFSSKTT